MDERPTHLDLFSGIGGFALAAQWAGFETIGFCEIDGYCQRILAKNFLANSLRQRRQQVPRGPYGDEEKDEGWPEKQHYKPTGCGESGGARIYSDIRVLDGRQFYGVSLITGGFPCQPFSCAGKQRGKEDDRHLWPEMFRVIKEAGSAWVLGENVPGIVGMELDTVLSDLEGIGYATRTFIIPACAVDAPHRRMRVWIIGHSTGTGLPDRASLSVGGNGELQPKSERSNSNRECRWPVEPNVGRVAHGIPHRVDRLKGLGNAIVPQVAYQILKGIFNEIIHQDAPYTRQEACRRRFDENSGTICRGGLKKSILRRSIQIK